MFLLIKQGHILDWIVYQSDNNFLLSSTVTNKLTSDHLAILCNLDLTIPEPTTVLLQFSTRRSTSVSP